MRIKVSLLIFVSCFAALGCKTESPTLPPPQPDPCKFKKKPEVYIRFPRPGTIYNPEVTLEVVIFCPEGCERRKFQIVDHQNRVVEEWDWERGRIKNEELPLSYTRAFIHPNAEGWKIRIFSQEDTNLRCPFDYEIPYTLGIPALRDYIERSPAPNLSIIPQGEVPDLEAILKFMNDYFTEGVVRFALNNPSGFPIYIYPTTSNSSPCPEARGCAVRLRGRCNIYLNTDKGGFDKDVVIHEIGHCYLAIAHSPDESSFMCSACDGLPVLNFPAEERWSMKVLNSQN